MNHLLQQLAPISDAGWTEINGEAKRSLNHFLAARKLLGIRGPLGSWSAVTLGPRPRAGRILANRSWVTDI